MISSCIKPDKFYTSSEKKPVALKRYMQTNKGFKINISIIPMICCVSVF